MKIIVFILIVAGSFAFAQEPDCERALQSQSLEDLMHAIVRQKLHDQPMAPILRLRLHQIAPVDLEAFKKLEAYLSNGATITMAGISSGENELKVDFRLQGTGRQILVALLALSDPQIQREMQMPRSEWSVLTTVGERFKNPERVLDEEMQRFLQRAISEFELSVRVLNRLQELTNHERPVLVGDVATSTVRELLEHPAFGPRSLIEVSNFLESHGLHLGMKLPGWPSQVETLR